jgi:uncharacterized protein (TIGR02453 family)
MSELPDERLFEFLDELNENNDRQWFAANKDRYLNEVLEPAVELVRRLEKPLAKLTPMIDVQPKTHNGSVMRIYRDTRFSKEKHPYKTNVGISFRHQADNDIHAPGFYIHFGLDECFVGAGCWRPPRQSLAAIRAAIASDPSQWKKVTGGKAFRESFEMGGERLKTAPRDYPKDHPIIAELCRIDFIGVCGLKRSELLGVAGVDKILDKIRVARPLMVFLCDALGVPY